MWYRAFFVGLLAVALASTSCSDKKDEILFGNPVPGGIGAVGASASALGAAVVVGLISGTAESSNPKPSPAKVAIGLAGEFPPSTTLDCGGGGSVEFSNVTTTGFNASVPDPGCDTNGFTFTTSGAGIVVTDMVLADCDEDGATTQVPVSAHVTVNGSASDGDQSISINGVEFHFETTVPDNVASSYSTGVGGTCSLLSGNIEIHGGNMSSSIAGESITAIFPNNTINVTFQDFEGSTQLTVDGDMAVQAPCTSGQYAVDIVTISPLIFVDGNLDPVDGEITANGETVNTITGIPAPCDGPVFDNL